jgi:antitoxin ParD1/3/4
MAAAARLNVDLTAELAEEVSAAVKSGEYRSPDEAVLDALRDWRIGRALRGYDIEQIRTLWREGLESGASIDAAPVFERLRGKYRAAAEAKE